MRYLVRSTLLHSIFLLLNECENNMEALPSSVTKAYEDVQRNLPGGLRLLARDRSALRTRQKRSEKLFDVV